MSTSRSRVATVPLIAGLAVLDLVNTVSWRGAPARSEDHLQEAGDCLTWAARAGVLTGIEADRLRHHLDQHPHLRDRLGVELRGLRDVVTFAVLEADRACLTAAQQVIVDALAHSQLDRSSGTGDEHRYQWSVPTLDEHTIARRLTLQLHTLLTSTHGRIGTCADTDCRWVFLDTSRSHQRRWCDSRDCGNRHRVRAHQQRQR